MNRNEQFEISNKAKSKRPEGLCDEVRGRGTKQGTFFDWEHAQTVCVWRKGGGGLSSAIDMVRLVTFSLSLLSWCVQRYNLPKLQ